MLLLSLLALQAATMPVRLDSAQCRPGTPHPVVVRISGFANRAGQVRVRLFGGPASSYFDKTRALVRTEVAVPKSGRVDICVPAPREGVYAVDVRHDVDGKGKTDRSDGGGTSGNPHLSLFDVILSRKPDPKAVQFTVGAGTTLVPVTLMYLNGGSFKPATSAE